MGIVKVNRTGKSFKVYKSNAGPADVTVGTIYNNEVFTWTGKDEGAESAGYYVQSICFRNKDGQKTSGWVMAAETDPQFETNLSEMAAKKVTMNGQEYFAFKMFRDEELYYNDARPLGKKAYKGRYILSEGSTSGREHPEWLSVRYLETGEGTGEYDEIVPGTNAFVDLGYDQGSTMGYNFSLIGLI